MKLINSMKKGVNKRGLSPVIASVLLILLVLVLATIIFLWARGFLNEQIEKFGKPISDDCSHVNFDVQRSLNNLEVINRGNVNINHLDIKLFKDGNSEISRFNVPIDAGETARQPITLTMKDGSTPDKIIVYPALIGNVRGKDSNKVFTCLDDGKTLQQI